MYTLVTENETTLPQKLGLILAFFELKLDEARNAVGAHRSATADADVLARIDSLTRFECINWALEMLPSIDRVQHLELSELVLELQTAQTLFRGQLEKMNKGLTENDMSDAQFPRVGSEARVELAARASTLSMVLAMTSDFITESV